jgi:hypothetical protein
MPDNRIMLRIKDEFYLTELTREVFDEVEIKMLRLAMSPVITQAELDSALCGWDIHKAGSKGQTIAFNISKTHPEVSFPKEYLNVLHRIGLSCRERYLTILPHFVKVIKVLEAKGLDFIILKGGAMRVYRPDYPRCTADVDILVPGSHYKKALDIFKNKGYSLFKSIHSTGLKDPATGQSLVDIHRFVGIGTIKAKRLSRELAGRALTLKFSSTTAIVPCPEDMVFISLVNFWKNVTDITSENSMANLCFDLKFLKDYSGGLNWDIVRSDARTTDTVEALYISKRLLEAVLPDFFPEGFIDEDIDSSKLRKLISRTRYTRNSVSVLRDFSLLGAIKNASSLSQYFFYRVKFFFVKRFHLIFDKDC